MCGAGAHAPSGPPWTSTTVGSARSRRPAARRSRRRSGPPAPGACGQRHHRLRVAPLPGGAHRGPDASATRVAAVRRRPGRAWTAPSRGCPRCPSQVTTPVRRGRERVGRRCRHRRAADGPAVGRSTGSNVNAATAASDRDPRRRPRSGRPPTQTGLGPAVDHPAGEVAVDPVADRAVEVGRRCRSARRRAVGRADEQPGAHVVERDRRRGSRPRRASGRRASRRDGSPSRPARGPRVARRSGASTSTAQIVVRGRRSASGPRSAVNATRPAVRAPGDPGDAPVARW